jgi:ankyrin repeat protein
LHWKHQSAEHWQIDEFRLDRGIMNPLIYAITNHYSDYYNERWINHLITHHRANINAQDVEGNTAVIYAMKNKSFELVVGLFNKYQVDISLQNNAGESVHFLAECRNYFKKKLARIVDGKKPFLPIKRIESNNKKLISFFYCYYYNFKF